MLKTNENEDKAVRQTVKTPPVTPKQLRARPNVGKESLSAEIVNAGADKRLALFDQTKDKIAPGRFSVNDLKKKMAKRDRARGETKPT